MPLNYQHVQNFAEKLLYSIHTIFCPLTDSKKSFIYITYYQKFVFLFCHINNSNHASIVLLSLGFWIKCICAFVYVRIGINKVTCQDVLMVNLFIYFSQMNLSRDKGWSCCCPADGSLTLQRIFWNVNKLGDPTSLWWQNNKKSWV